jgi:hypothetical protein
MKARPILFSTPMVQALLAGQKTQTRRIVKPQPSVGDCWRRWVVESTHKPHEGCASWAKDHRAGPMPEALHARCPYGKLGDVLWVKERLIAGPYETSGRYFSDGLQACDGWPWKRKSLPSIHMPRGLSRLTLEIAGVRVERLHDISREDAAAEGVPHTRWQANGLVYGRIGPIQQEYGRLWESINGKDSWAANPWVWVLEFAVHKQNADEIIRGRKSQ